MRPRPHPAPAGPAIRALEGRLDPDAPVRLGVISNPFSRTNSRTRLNDRLLPRFLPDPRNAIDTRTVEDLDQALYTLLFERDVNVVGLNGGDGTLHLAVNRLMVMRQEAEERTGHAIPLPPLLFLNGGTLNIVSRATGTRGNPARTVRRFVQGARDATLGQLHSRDLGLLEVTVESKAPRYGFVFGSEVVANALEMYSLFGEGYVGLARFLAEVAGGYTLHTRLWQEHGWKLDPPATPVTLDGVTWSHYLGAVASTIDLAILRGVVRALRVDEGSPGFVSRLLLETRAGPAIRMIPRLMFEQPHPSIHAASNATHLRTCGGYTLDGELFLDRSTEAARRPLDVRRAPLDVRAVTVSG